MNLTVCSYNCCSLKNNINVIRELTDRKVDLIFLQETFLLSKDFHILDYVHEDYKGIGVSATFSEKSIQTASGRPMGGLTCLYKTDTISNINIVSLNEDIMIIKLIIGNVEVIFVNVYVRSDLGDPLSIAAYLNNLHEIEASLQDVDYNSIFILGDFNADPSGGRSWNNLNEFILRNNFSCFDRDVMSADTFTHVSFGHGSCKWLDHIIGRTMDGVTVGHIDILHELVGSDHFPLICKLNIPKIAINPSYSVKQSNSNDYFFVDWDAVNDDDLHDISVAASHIQGDFSEFCDSSCQLGCSDANCFIEISNLYNSIVNSVGLASLNYQKRRIKKNKFKVIPGWNRNVKSYYETARTYYLEWLRNDKSRNHVSFENMKASRSEFKRKLKLCKNNRDEEVFISINEKFKDNNKRNFWKEVNSRKGGSETVGVIDGRIVPFEIVSVFESKFLPDDGLVTNLNGNAKNLINDYWNNIPQFNLCISSVTLKDLIKGLNKGIGHDGVHSKLLKFACDSFIENITRFLNLCFLHCYFPPELLRGEITPVVKNKKGNRFDSNNYRPVMQSSCLLKLCEMHLLNYLNDKLYFNNKQFGFSHGTSTTDACFLLKETINNYKSNLTPVYANFIDLSKAFDSYRKID